MTRALIIYFSCIIIICSCKKENAVDNATPPHNDTTPANTYSIAGAGNAGLKNNISHTTLNFMVNKLGEEQPTVTLSVSSLPEYTSLTFANAKSTVPFDADVKIQSVFTTPGTYTLNLDAISGTNEKKQHPLNLAINPTGDRECADFFLKNCVVHQDAGFLFRIVDGKTLSMAIEKNKTTGLLEIVSALFWLGGQDGLFYSADSTGIPFNVNCNNRTILIEQTEIFMYNGSGSVPYTFFGSGTINPEKKSYEIACTLKNAQSGDLLYTITGNILMD